MKNDKSDDAQGGKAMGVLTHRLVKRDGRDEAKCGSPAVHLPGRDGLTYFGQRVTCATCRLTGEALRIAREFNTQEAKAAEKNGDRFIRDSIREAK